MYAVEFQATIQNGFIEVPEKYRYRFRKPVRVILLAPSEEEEEKSTSYIKHLLENPLHIPNFEPLSREEAHERE